MHKRIFYPVVMIILISLLAGLLGGCSQPPAADPLSVRVESIEGSVSVLSVSGETRKLSNQDSLQPGDKVTTEDYASCRIVYENGTETTLGSGTSVIVNQADSSGVRLNVTMGKVWIKVKHLIIGEETFETETRQVNAAVRGTLFYVDAGSGESTYIALLDGILAAGGSEAELPNTAAEAGAETAWLEPFQQLEVSGTENKNIESLKSGLNVNELLESADRPLLQQMLLDLQERIGEGISADQRLSDLAKQLEEALKDLASEARGLLDYVLTDKDIYSVSMKGGYLDEKSGILYRSIQSEFPKEITFFTNAGEVKWSSAVLQAKPVIFRIHDPKLINKDEIGILDQLTELGLSIYPKVAGWKPLNASGEVADGYSEYIPINGASGLPIEELMRRNGQQPADYEFVDIQG